MPLVFNYSSKKTLIFCKLFLLLTIFFTVDSNSYRTRTNHSSTSQFSHQNVLYKKIPLQNHINFSYSKSLSEDVPTHSSTEVTTQPESHTLKEREDETENILALLCSELDKTEILKGIYDFACHNSSKISGILYLTSPSELPQIYESVAKDRDKSRINLIYSESTTINEDSILTIATSSSLLGYYNLFNNNIPYEGSKVIKLNGSHYCKSADEEFRKLMKSLIDSYLMGPSELENLDFVQKPNIVLDKELLTSPRDWINQNYMETDQVLKRLLNSTGKRKIVMFDDFGLRYHLHSNSLSYTFNDEIVALMKKDCKFFATTSSIYNPQHVKDWLCSILGGIKVVTMSKTPDFEVLTNYGSINPFTEESVSYAKKFSKIDPNNTMEIYKYFTKNSNLMILKNTNPKLDDFIVRSIQDSLKDKGIDTLNKLLRHSKVTHSMLKKHVRRIRTDPKFANSGDKLHLLLKHIVDVSKNRRLSQLVKTLMLNISIRKQQRPSASSLVEYVNSKNLYPSVIYAYGDTLEEILEDFFNLLSKDTVTPENWKSQNMSYDSHIFDHLGRRRMTLIEKGIATVANTDPVEYKRFVKRNLENFRIVISEEPIPSAKHYIFMELFVPKGFRKISMTNVELYSLTQGGRLVTFTMDTNHLPNTLSRLISPMYLNLNRLEEKESESHNFSDVLSRRLFTSYLRSCKELYTNLNPDYFQKKDYKEKLGDYLTNSKVDCEHIVRLNKKKQRFKRLVNTLQHSILSKFFFRTKLISLMNTVLHLRGSTVLGLDDSKYRVKYFGSNPIEVLDFPNEDLQLQLRSILNSFKSNPVILENLETRDIVLTENSFIKDILDLEESQDSENEKFSVDFISHIRLSPENDLNGYLESPNLWVNYVNISSMNEIKNPRLTSILAKRDRDWLLEGIQEDKGNLEIIEKMIERASNKEKYEETDIKEDKQDIKLLLEEYVKLDRDLKRDDLEHIAREKKLVRSLWGK